MLYTKEELNKVTDILEDDKASRLISSLDTEIEKVDEDLPLASDIIETGINELKKKRMCISEVNFVEKGNIVDRGYIIEVEDDNSNFRIESQYIISNGKLPVAMITKLTELSSVGYKLVTFKDSKPLCIEV